MLGFVFGFNARLGRLQFFLASLALAVSMTAVCFAIALTLARTISSGTIRPEEIARHWAVIPAIVVFGFATVTLQSMRIRDIGWDPVCVIPAWISLLLVDHAMAGRFPAWAIGPEHQATAIGGTVNHVLMLALTFWPSADRVGGFAGAFQPTATNPLISTDRLARAAQGSPRPTWH
jgi:uncharacterized membrane protein YhaH (DUF805 family)